MPEQPMAQTVLSDAQLSMVTVLKPFPNFENVYQGRPAIQPIAFPGGLDADAGRPGFSPVLQRGVEVPMGARCCLWIPLASSEEFANIQLYRYDIIWRLRNVTDYRNRRKPYHLRRQAPGAVDTSVVPNQPRFVIPAGSQVIGYEQPEAGATDGDVNLRAQHWVPIAGQTQRPLTPGGAAAVLGQGIIDPAVDPALNASAIWNVFRFDAEGDEMIILASRLDTTSPSSNWDFTSAAADQPFSNIYGTDNGAHPALPDLGIYLSVGVNP